MLKRLSMALTFAVLGVIASTGSAMAAFDPTKDELSLGTFIKSKEVEIPDHAHDHRYAGHH